jgi:hypothetical protein
MTGRVSKSEGEGAGPEARGGVARRERVRRRSASVGMSSGIVKMSVRRWEELDGAEEGAGFEEEEFGTAGFIEELEGAVGAFGFEGDLIHVAGVGGEQEELAVGHLAMDFFGELEAAFVGHGDVGEQEAGREGACACETFFGGVGGLGVVAVGLEDEIESVGDQMVVVDDENTLLHGRHLGPNCVEENPGLLREEENGAGERASEENCY